MSRAPLCATGHSFLRTPVGEGGREKVGDSRSEVLSLRQDYSYPSLSVVVAGELTVAQEMYVTTYIQPYPP